MSNHDHYTDKNCGRVLRRRRRIVPNFLKMRMFLSKWVNCSPISTKMFSFWENWRTFSVFFSWFSHDLWQCTCVYSCLPPSNYDESSLGNRMIAFVIVKSVLNCLITVVVLTHSLRAVFLKYILKGKVSRLYDSVFNIMYSVQCVQEIIKDFISKVHLTLLQLSTWNYSTRK